MSAKTLIKVFVNKQLVNCRAHALTQWHVDVCVASETVYQRKSFPDTTDWGPKFCLFYNCWAHKVIYKWRWNQTNQEL